MPHTANWATAKGEERRHASGKEAAGKALAGKGLVTAPGVYDMISAKIADAMGFSALYMTGYGVSASLGLPDAGLASYTEMVERVAQICQGTSTPVICDADTGFGGLLNVERTVQGYERGGRGRRSRSRTRCSPRNAGTRRAAAWCPSSRWCARSRWRRRAAPRPTSSSSPAPTRAPTTGSTRRCGAGRPTPRPAPTSCSSRARRARRRWRASAGISTCRCSPTWPTAGARRSCPRSGWRSSATASPSFPVTGLLATAKALEHVYGVLKDKGSSDTLAARALSLRQASAALVGFEHVWEFDKRWSED